MNDTIYQQELRTVEINSRRDVMRAELEETRAAFQHVLASVGIDGWRQKSPASA